MITTIDCSAFKCEEGKRCILGKYLLASQAGHKCNTVTCATFEAVYILHDRYEKHEIGKYRTIVVLQYNETSLINM